VNTRVSSEVTFIFTTAKKSVGVHADTEMPLHEGFRTPASQRAPAPEESMAFANDPVKLRLGGTANLPAA
jgi:hypothetical protein